MQKAAISRANLSEELVTVVRQMVVDGSLPAGARINEVHLANRLGVSRTPLREALGRLSAEGALSGVARIGYFVRPLTAEEVEQIYPIRAILDPEALRLAGIPSAGRLGKLEALNRRIRDVRDPAHVIGLDDAWHLGLVADCPNRVLIALIEQFILRTRRYELALMRERRNVRNSTDDHRRILRCLRAGRLEAACEELRRNMQSGVEPIVSWLRARTATKREVS